MLFKGSVKDEYIPEQTFVQALFCFLSWKQPMYDI